MKDYTCVSCEHDFNLNESKTPIVGEKMVRCPECDSLNIKYNTEDYEKDEYGNLLSGCCGCILDRETMICPLCKENC